MVQVSTRQLLGGGTRTRFHASYVRVIAGPKRRFCLGYARICALSANSCSWRRAWVTLWKGICYPSVGGSRLVDLVLSFMSLLSLLLSIAALANCLSQVPWYQGEMKPVTHRQERDLRTHSARTRSLWQVRAEAGVPVVPVRPPERFWTCCGRELWSQKLR